MTNTFSTRSNAMRAARKALGADAKVGTDFTLTTEDDGRVTWAKVETITYQGTTKLGAVLNLMRRPQGATVQELMAATGWQRHTVRGAISGTVGKRLGLTVGRLVEEGRGRVYRLDAE
jgi:hypothetical protein